MRKEKHAPPFFRAIFGGCTFLQAMLLAIHIAQKRLLREVPQAPFEHRISFCGCAFLRTLLTLANSMLARIFTNMMITNIITHRHEFATMQSIGKGGVAQ